MSNENGLKNYRYTCTRVLRYGCTHVFYDMCIRKYVFYDAKRGWGRGHCVRKSNYLDTRQCAVLTLVAECNESGCNNCTIGFTQANGGNSESLLPIYLAIPLEGRQFQNILFCLHFTEHSIHSDIFILYLHFLVFLLVFLLTH